MPTNKILCIGNNSEDTDQSAQKISQLFKKPYYGFYKLDNLDPKFGVYHTSIEDLSINKIYEILNRFDQIEIFEQEDSQDREAYLQRIIIKNQLHLQDIVYPSIENKILFVGCSHTDGVGHKNKRTVYTSLFSTYFQREALVEGLPGKGNFLIEKKLNSYSLKCSNVIIQFTDIFRIRYYDSKGKLRQTQGPNFTKEEVDLFSEEKLMKDFLECVDRIVLRLRDSSSNFLFFRLSHLHESNLKIDYELSKYKEFCWIPDANQDLANDNEHFGEKSHRLICNRLIERWKKLYA